MSKRLAGKVCLVTGGTRGIGRGIALQLGQAGATVYVTGRTLRSEEAKLGSLEDTAKEIEARGGRCIPVVCDHKDDHQVAALFTQIEQEQNGQLDILVNNAYSGVLAISENVGVPFWEQEMTMWDETNNVGLRNHYLCTVHAAKLMTKRKKGLIANISSACGLFYFINVPFCIGKQANDRMAADCALELRKEGVAMVSLWPGIVRTELVMDIIAKGAHTHREHNKPGESELDVNELTDRIKKAESTEFTGRALVELAQDPDIMKKSGRVLIVSDLAAEYGFTDIDGRVIPSLRSVKYQLQIAGWTKMAWLVPAWVKVPCAALTLAASRF